MYLEFLQEGVLEIEENGNALFYSQNLKEALIFKKTKNEHRFVYYNNKHTSKSKHRENFYLYWEKNNHHLEVFDSSFFSPVVPEYLEIGKDSIILYSSQNILFIANKRLIKNRKIKTDAIRCVMDDDGSFWLCRNNLQGLLKFDNLDSLLNGKSQSILQGQTVTSIFKDKDGGYWVSTLQSGVWYFSGLNIQVFNEQNGIVVPNFVALTKAKNDLIALTFDGSLYKGANDTGNIQLISSPYRKRNKWDVSYFEKGKKIYLADRLSAFQNKMFYPNKIPNMVHRVKVLEKENILFAGGGGDFFLINTLTDSLLFKFDEKRFYTIESLGNNTFILGATDGLYQLKNFVLSKLSGQSPLFSQRIEDSGVLSDSTLVFGTKGAGVFLFKNDSILQITESNGLVNNMVERIHIANDNSIWVATLSGLSHIVQDEHNIWHPYNLKMSNGLPSNEINDIQSIGDEIWIATSKGLVKIPKTIPAFVLSKPIIRKVLVNGENFKNQNLDYTQNNIEIQYIALMLYMNGDILYRYRTSPKADWTETKNTTVNFSKLASGTYDFEIQARNQNQQWSKSTFVKFEITPPFWQKWYFYLFLLGGISAGIYLYFQNKLKLSEQKIKQQSQIFELERAVTQAQMDPHFLFNGLNSIQNMISKGERVEAMRYLSKFSELIRFNLQSSILSTISLETELNFLRKYLDIELLRFKNSFTYNIELEEAIEDDFFDLQIPPMLIQPLIENATKHGLTSRNGDGKLSVRFSTEGDFLVVQVSDNGLNEIDIIPKNAAHKSMGTDLVQKRLALFNGKISTPYYSLGRQIIDDERLTIAKIKINIKKEFYI